MNHAMILSGCLVLSCPIAWSQPAAPAFEVASIKVHEFPPGMTGLQVGGPSALQISGNRVTTSGSLATFIMGAYGMRLHTVSGGPEWTDRDGNPVVFDIQAKAEGDGVLSPQQARLMMQTLLADRFHVKFHRESREMPAYALVVDKNGPKLQAAAPDTESKASGTFSRGIWKSTYTNISMADLVGRIASNFDRPVFDKTGLQGGYDITLEYRRNLKDLSAGVPVGEAGPTIYTALQKVGLKVVSAKEPVEIIVIDHAEKPSEN